jgi:hypothetical protein
VRELVGRRARWYVEPAMAPPREDGELHAWLTATATPVHDDAAGRIWRLPR